MPITPVLLGRPCSGNLAVAREWYVSSDGVIEYLPGGRLISTANSRDPGNAPDTHLLRPGLMMGRRAADGQYAPSVLGLTLAAVAAGAANFTVPVATAAEIVRRIGGSGTLLLVGPPTAGGTVASQSVAYTAVNTATGVVTGTVPAAAVLGSAVSATDGSALPLSMIGDGYGVRLDFNTPTVATEWPRVPIRMTVESDRVIDWPPDAAVRSFYRASLSSPAGGKFVFRDQF